MHFPLDSPVEKLVQAVRIRTVSQVAWEKRNPREFKKFHRFIRSAFPALYKVCTVIPFEDTALMLVWQGLQDKKNPVGIVAHYDVVPAENHHLWTHPPFEGAVEDGYVWGRGTLDMKGSLVALLEGGNQLAEAGFVPNRSHYFLLGGDEEITGTYGAGEMCSFLKEQGVFFDALYDEGSVVTSGMIPGVDQPAAMVGVAEKGQLTVLLKAEGADGHASRPPKNTAVGVLCRAVAAIENNPFPLRLTPSVLQFVTHLAPHLPGIQRVLLSNIRLFKNIVMKQLSKDSNFAALFRTTQAPTVIRGGDAGNALPMHAEALINCRLLPGDTVKGVLLRYERLLRGLDVEVSAATGTASNEAISASSIESEGYNRLAESLRAVYPDAVILPYIITVATDSRNFADITGGIYRIMPFLVDSDELGRIHGLNERLSVENLQRAVTFYKIFLQKEYENERT